MTAIVYCPETNRIYEWDGWFLYGREYTDVGALEDETGATYYQTSIIQYGSLRGSGLIKLDELRD